MKSLSTRILFGALPALAALLISAALAQDKKAAAPAKPALTVAVVTPLQSDLPVTLSANGALAAWQETLIGAEVNGLRLNDVRVNVGDVVKAGQVLASFMADTVETEVAQQKAAVAEAEAARDEAAANAARARSLADSGALSKQQIEQYLNAARTADARLMSARAALTAANIRLKHTQVVAPDDGVISARMATLGAVAQPGQELFRLIRDGRLEWRGEVAAADLTRVRPGQRVTLTLPGNGVAGKAMGRVRQVAPTIDEKTRNGLVYADLIERGSARAGMYVKGDFELGSAGALTVPQQAVVVRDGFSYVFTVGADSRVTRIRVTTGRRNSDRVEIVQGLKADQAVVAAGAGFLNDGDLVAVSAAKPAAANASAPAKK
ncbi:MAG: efflux RND transporter periplasmic adaptor subunit [Betaproteobacteria bacterium]|nr:efflux RND transporter periplasmic adaptor subunit [Betaproteobacteria bacterium]